MAQAIDSIFFCLFVLCVCFLLCLFSDKLGQSDFLKLMTSQLRNQDPMQPMDIGAFLGQIAQFSQVSGIQDMQASVKQLVDTLSSNQAMQASSQVGKTVVAPAESDSYTGKHAVQGAVPDSYTH